MARGWEGSLRGLVLTTALAMVQSAVAQGSITQVEIPKPVKPASYEASLRIAKVFVPAGPEVPPLISAVSTKLPASAVELMRRWTKERPHMPPDADKMRAYEATMPSVIDEVLVKLVPSVQLLFAARFSELWTADEAAAIADFVESEAGRESLQAMFTAGAEERLRTGQNSPTLVYDVALAMSAETLSAIAAFQSSPAGKAFTSKRDAVSGLAADVTTKLIDGPLIARLREDICRDIAPAWCR